MIRFLRHELLHVVLVLLLVSIALAFLIDLTPGDPAYAILGANATDEQIAQVHQELQLDDPFYERYATWAGGIIRGDLGTSYLSDQPVMELILDRVGPTVELIVLALLMALLISVPVSIYTAYRSGRLLDRLWTFASSVLIAIPPFVSALLVVFVLAVTLEGFVIHFPASGWVSLSESVPDNLWHAFLPALVLALVEIPAFSRVLRADMAATLRQDFILAARARGLPTGRILVRHALRPSSFSLVTMLSLSFARLMGGVIVVETLFAVPGLGQLLIVSIANKDIPVVQGVVMFIAIVYVVLNTLVDVAYRALDPRVRIGSATS